jgi:hypothetical protein
MDGRQTPFQMPLQLTGHGPYNAAAAALRYTANNTGRCTSDKRIRCALRAILSPCIEATTSLQVWSGPSHHACTVRLPASICGPASVSAGSGAPAVRRGTGVRCCNAAGVRQYSSSTFTGPVTIPANTSEFRTQKRRCSVIIDQPTQPKSKARFWPPHARSRSCRAIMRMHASTSRLCTLRASPPSET